MRGDPVEPPFGCKALGPKVGDAVRVAFVGQLIRDEDQTLYVTDGSGARVHLFGPLAQADTGFAIEVVEPPLKVGDRVKVSGLEGSVLCIDGDAAFVKLELKYQEPTRRVYPLSSLERVS